MVEQLKLWVKKMQQLHFRKKAQQARLMTKVQPLHLKQTAVEMMAAEAMAAETVAETKIKEGQKSPLFCFSSV
jgi:hypothetical protein